MINPMEPKEAKMDVDVNDVIESLQRQIAESAKLRAVLEAQVATQAREMREMKENEVPNVQG
jgi:hypothetical protein